MTWPQKIGFLPSHLTWSICFLKMVTWTIPLESFPPFLPWWVHRGVTTPSPLDEVTLSDLKTRLKSFLSENQILILEVKIDLSIMGGMIVWREIYWYVCKNQDLGAEQGYVGGFLKVLIFCQGKFLYWSNDKMLPGQQRKKIQGTV